MNLLKYVIILTGIMSILILVSGCTDNNETSAEYKGVKYEGEGNTETMIDVVIRNSDHIIYIGKVKIVDDTPTVWEALAAIIEHDENVVSIEKNEDGKVIKVNTIENSDNSKWFLSVNNNVTDENVENIDISNVEEETITLSFEKDE